MKGDQARRALELFRDASQLDATPVDEFMSMLVARSCDECLSTLEAASVVAEASLFLRGDAS